MRPLRAGTNHVPLTLTQPCTNVPQPHRLQDLALHNLNVERFESIARSQIIFLFRPVNQTFISNAVRTTCPNFSQERSLSLSFMLLRTSQGASLQHIFSSSGQEP